MARRKVISQLQTVGEDALERLAQNPAARTAIHGAMQVKERGERLLHAVDEIEERLSAIEARLGALEGSESPGGSPETEHRGSEQHTETFAPNEDDPGAFDEPAEEDLEDF